VVVITRDGALVQGEVGDRGHDDWAPAGGELTAARLPAAGVPDDAPLLGLDAAGAPVFARFGWDGGELPDGVRALDLRAAAALLPGADAGLLAQAATLLAWHRDTAFCGRCGEPTEPREGGHMRVCANGHQHHPRTDPVVIMLVVDGDRVLLGRQPSWPERRYSALAGFVEPGETLEAAVAREIREEARVEVGEVRYVASQPWPFPRSLMIGFEAQYAAGRAAVGDEELDDVRWVTRDELRESAEREPDGPIILPPRLAIARHLLERWLART
jgi:NAD+ diphosphatase